MLIFLAAVVAGTLWWAAAVGQWERTWCIEGPLCDWVSWLEPERSILVVAAPHALMTCLLAWFISRRALRNRHV